jgi:hypothetical protein
MELINILCDQSRVRNTGKAACIKKFGWFKGGLPVPKDWRLTGSQIADFVAEIQDALIADSYDDRIFMFGPFVNNVMAYGDKTTVSNADGSEDVIRGATAGWSATVKAGGMCYMRALLSFDDLQDNYNWVIINHEGSFIGGAYWNEATGEDEFGGLSLSKLEVETPMVGETSDVDRYMVNYRLADKDQLFNRAMVIDTTIDPFSELDGILDVTLKQLTAITVGGGFDLGMSAGCGSVNLGTSSSSATWANVARFSAKNATTGAAITISSASVANGVFTIDLDAADPDYPAIGEYLTLELVSVSALAGVGLEYYESYADNPAVGISGKQLYIKIP